MFSTEFSNSVGTRIGRTLSRILAISETTCFSTSIVLNTARSAPLYASAKDTETKDAVAFTTSELESILASLVSFSFNSKPSPCPSPPKSLSSCFSFTVVAVPPPPKAIAARSASKDVEPVPVTPDEV